MPHAVLTPAAPTDRAALLPPPPTAAEPRGTAWCTAITAARAAHRAARVVPRSTHRAARAPAADGRMCAARTNALASSLAPALVLITSCTGGSLLEREIAARAVGLRTLAIRPSWGAPTPGPVVPFKPSRIDPLNREPTAKSATVPFQPSGIDPLNREPAAKPRSTIPFKPSRIDPLNREPMTKPGPTVPFKPSRVDPLNREPTAKPAPTAPFKPSRIGPLNREPGTFQDPEPPTKTALARTRSHPRTHAMRHTRAAGAAGKKIFAADGRR